MIILITGANRGLGLCLAAEGLRRGHRIIACCRSPSAELAALTEQYPRELAVLTMDVASEESVQAAAGELAALTDRVDVIINNAAVLLESKYFEGDPLTDLPLADFETTMNVNILGPIRVLHYCAEFLYRSGKPMILNITSEGAALKPAGSHYIAYSVSKYGLNMFTQKIRNYFTEKRGCFPVKIFMVHPGRMNTVMGVENAQIEPEIPAAGILDIIDGITAVPDMTVPFIDYSGNPMPDHYIP
ncbi:SDR family NAD(P)-dependent oxidoreductase [Breznakiella homolactica]|uniref:SDR family NAD(P)-dependent oxidoreductase n=1 Tax=Breznakiella homolactica TaxID=2798577 RepID=A0A7T7XRS8_9SPIR|nr:SDR family NAD(P)-dependent oxidoreductase [Breznakiella homolactica]QQO11244.1 SDR family NAD(P)-dependent oxidoreductase [Breznakiella homolactica]